jgi:hypothetical protein
MANHGYFAGQIFMLAAAFADFLGSIFPRDFLHSVASVAHCNKKGPANCRAFTS